MFELIKRLKSKVINKEEKEFQKVVNKHGTRFQIYVHCNDLMKRSRKKVSGLNEILYEDITPIRDEFLFLDGIRGAFKVEGVKEMGHSVQYLFDLIREEPPKDYTKKIEIINRYSTNKMDVLF